MIAWSGSWPIVSQRLERVNSASSVNTLGGGGDVLCLVCDICVVFKVVLIEIILELSSEIRKNVVRSL